jgi:hypothetical protein
MLRRCPLKPAGNIPVRAETQSKLPRDYPLRKTPRFNLIAKGQARRSLRAQSRPIENRNLPLPVPLGLPPLKAAPIVLYFTLPQRNVFP